MGVSTELTQVKHGTEDREPVSRVSRHGGPESTLDFFLACSIPPMGNHLLDPIASTRS